MASKTKRRRAWAPFFTQEAKIINTVFLSYNSRLISHKAIASTVQRYISRGGGYLG